MPTWESPHQRRLPAIGPRTLIMGVLNATPDSFSDGGLHLDPENAAQRAGQMIAEGADILDIGGESTRPGAEAVEASQEIDRVLPLITAIRKRHPEIPISIDTYKSTVAQAAVEYGADMINDVRGLTYALDEPALVAWKKSVAVGDPNADLDPSPMAIVAAEKRCPVIIMHNRPQPNYQDFWPDLLSDLRIGLALARNAGIPAHQVWLDPGFGFGKKPAHNLEVLKNLGHLSSLGYPLLLGTSRKSTLGLVLDRPVEQRLEGTAATVVWGIAQGCHMVRVHDVAAIVPYLRMTDAIRMGLNFPAS